MTGTACASLSSRSKIHTAVTHPWTTESEVAMDPVASLRGSPANCMTSISFPYRNWWGEKHRRKFPTSPSPVKHHFQQWSGDVLSKSLCVWLSFSTSSGCWHAKDCKRWRTRLHWETTFKSLDEGFSTFSMVCACLNPPPCIKGAFFFPSSKVLVSQPYS